MQMNRVEGNDYGADKALTLSTCVWCKKTKALLQEMNVAYEYVDVDLLEGEEREKALDELKRFNPRCSFPSLVVNNDCISWDTRRKDQGGAAAAVMQDDVTQDEVEALSRRLRSDAAAIGLFPQP